MNSTLPPPPHARRKPPGPSWSPRTFLRLARDPLGTLTELSRAYGSIAYVRLLAERIFVVSDPALIKEVLVTHSKNFTKGRGLERGRRVLGEGLLTSEGPRHLRQRRMMQPSFHRERIAAFAAVMVEEAGRTMRAWRDGQEIDIVEEMKQLTLAIVTRTLFGLDSPADAEAQEVSAALNAVMDGMRLMMLPFPALIERLPLRSVTHLRQAREKLDEIIHGMIAKRRGEGLEGGDLLSMLLRAQDPEDGGEGMTDAQVRDEAMTIFLAGHETTANALNWTWHLLSQHPAVAARMRAELDAVLAGRTPAAADYPALAYTGRVVMESMRLLPPAWLVARRAVAAQELGDHVLPPRSMVMMSQWVVHRDPRYFPDPLKFDPDRWTPEFRAGLPKYAYFPFGGGPRQCIGEGFAWMEAVLALATIAQRWEIAVLPGQSIVPEASVTLRPKGAIRVRLQARPFLSEPHAAVEKEANSALAA